MSFRIAKSSPSKAVTSFFSVLEYVVCVQHSLQDQVTLCYCNEQDRCHRSQVCGRMDGRLRNIPGKLVCLKCF